MLFNYQIFQSYDLLVYDLPDFKPGQNLIPLKNLRKHKGFAAQTLVYLAELFGISEETGLLTVKLKSDLMTDGIYGPSYQTGLNPETQVKEFYFVMGDVQIPFSTLLPLLKSKGVNFMPEIKKVGPEKEQVEVGCFTIQKPSKGIVQDSDSITFTFSYAADVTEARQKVVDLFRTDNWSDNLLNSGVIRDKDDSSFSVQLKEVPIGAYFINNAKWTDNTFARKDGTGDVQIKQWLVSLESYTDHSKIKAQVAPTSKLGDYFNTDPELLDRVGDKVPQDQKKPFILVIKAHNKASNGGVSVDLGIIKDLAIAERILKASASPALEATPTKAIASAQPIKSASVAAIAEPVTTVNVTSEVVAESQVSANEIKPDDDIPF